MVDVQRVFHCVNCEGLQRQYDILLDSYNKLNKYVTESKISANPKGAGSKVEVSLGESHYLILGTLEGLGALSEATAVTNNQIRQVINYKHSVAVVGGRLSDLKGHEKVVMIYKKDLQGRTKPHWFRIS